MDRGTPSCRGGAERKILPFVTSVDVGGGEGSVRRVVERGWAFDDALLLVAMARGFLRGGSCAGDDAENVTRHYERADEIFRGRLVERVRGNDRGRRRRAASLEGNRSLADAAEATFLRVADAVRADVDAVSAEFRHLAAMNQSAGARYAAIGRRVGDAHVFADKVRKVQETGIAPQLERLDTIEASVGSLENVAQVLDAGARSSSGGWRGSSTGRLATLDSSSSLDSERARRRYAGDDDS